MKAFLSRLGFVVVLLYCCALLYLVLRPLLSYDMLSGWDFLPQYYLVQTMHELLQQGHITGYDPNWFAGYPAFSFYGPLPYALTAFLSDFLRETYPISERESIIYAFNLLVFALPFAALFLSIITARVLVGGGIAASTAFLLVTMLLKGGEAHVAPVSVYTTLLHGHFASFFAFVLLQLLILVVSVQLRFDSILLRIAGVFLTSCIILSHVLTSLFVAFWYIGIFFLCGGKGRKEVFLTGSISSLLTSFWWYPFLKHMWLTSGQQAHTPNYDPVLAFFPEVSYLSDCFKYLSSSTLLGFPFHGLLFFLSLVIGISLLIRRQSYLLPLSFLGLLLFLPRQILTEVIDIPVHSYRFLFPLFAFAVPIAGLGLHEIFSEALKPRRAGIVLSVFLYLLVFLSAFQLAQSVSGDPYANPTILTRLKIQESASCGGKASQPPIEPLKEAPQYEDLKEILAYLSYYRPDGRVAVEVHPYDLGRIGSPHAFLTLLPFLYDIPVVPGLLAESSFSAGFLIPTLAYGSDSLLWGRQTLYERNVGSAAYSNPLFTDRDMVKRLAYYRVQYIISSSDHYKESLIRISQSASEEESEIAPVEMVLEAGSYAVFKLSEYAPEKLTSSYKPFLYIERGGPDFRTFSEEWFKEDSLHDYPVIYTPRNYKSLSPQMKASIGGFIFSYRENWVALSEEELEEIQGTDKPVILLNRRDKRGDNAPELKNIHFISYFGRNTDELENGGLLEVRGLLKNYAGEEPVWSESGEGAAGGTIYMDSYHPSWRNYEFQDEMFAITPSFIYLPAGESVR